MDRASDDPTAFHSSKSKANALLGLADRLMLLALELSEKAGANPDSEAFIAAAHAAFRQSLKIRDQAGGKGEAR